MKDHFYAVIMAGGGGTRLWPVSRKNFPKQMLRINADLSLFQLAINRLKGFFPPEKIFIVTVAEQVKALKKECPEISENNYLIEPAPRGTASVVGLAASHIKSLDKDGVMAVLTADHVIENVPLFQRLLSSAYEAANKKFLVTLGIEPVYPSTGYGYIESGIKLDQFEGLDALKVNRFVEKPNRENAQRFLDRGGYFWNSGMFIWHVHRILDEFKEQMPLLFNTLELLSSVSHQSNYQEILNKEWLDITPQTIDYGIMEHAKNVVVLPAKGLGWSDVGTWDSLVDFLQKDEQGNINISDQSILLDTNNTILYQSGSGRICAIIGMQDAVVVDTKDALLICKRGETQKVRQMVEILKKNEMYKYL
jgi:mannose-1-phosphate guanylyltransferase